MSEAQRRIEWTPTASRAQNKRAGKREAMLERLKVGPATTWDLMIRGGSGFSSRLAELRAAGYVIDCDENEQCAWYTLRSEP